MGKLETNVGSLLMISGEPYAAINQFFVEIQETNKIMLFSCAFNIKLEELTFHNLPSYNIS